MLTTASMLRRIQRHPSRSLLMILTLALGLGATTAVVSAIRTVLLAPLPYAHPEQLVVVAESENEEGGFGTVGYTTFDEWRANVKSFASLAAIASRTYTLTGGGEAEQLNVLGITANTFATFGVHPILGRDLSPRDDVRAAPRVLVLSHELWQRRFGGDPGIIGKTVRMSGLDFEVIGVMPPRIRMLADEWRASHNDAWTAMRYDPSLPYACRSCRHLQIVGRLRDGVTAEQAAREVETRTAAMRRQYPNDYPSNGITSVTSLQDAIVGRTVTSSLWIILGIAALVLIAAIANAGSLGLSEVFVRHNELVVRQSLGATPLRIALLLISESIVQALLASIAGVGLAYIAASWLRAHAGAFLPRAADLAIDPYVVAVCVAAAVLSGIVIGAIPALRARQWPLVASGRGVVSTRSRAQKILVGGNVALSVVLLIGSTLLLRTVRNLFSIPPGFDATHAIAFRMAVEGETYPDEKALLAFYDRLLNEARQVPGVESIALTSQLPFAENNDNAGIFRENEANPADAPSPQRFAITPAYFATLRIPILRGRTFTNEEAEPVIILNEITARTLFPNGDALHRRVRFGGQTSPLRRIVGVVGNVAPGDLGAPATLQAYLPMSQFTTSEVTGIARTTSGAAPLRELVRRIDPGIPFYRVASLATLVSRSEARRQFILACISAFSMVVLALAMIGVYGILALFVSSRRRELALRVALGASGGGVFRFVLAQGLRLAGLGILGGLAASLVLGRFLAAMLYGVHNGDPATLVSVTMTLGLATAIACAVPAWRAARVAPEAALREE